MHTDAYGEARIFYCKIRRNVRQDYALEDLTRSRTPAFSTAKPVAHHWTGS